MTFVLGLFLVANIGLSIEKGVSCPSETGELAKYLYSKATLRHFGISKKSAIALLGWSSSAQPYIDTATLHVTLRRLSPRFYTRLLENLKSRLYVVPQRPISRPISQSIVAGCGFSPAITNHVFVNYHHPPQESELCSDIENIHLALNQTIEEEKALYLKSIERKNRRGTSSLANFPALPSSVQLGFITHALLEIYRRDQMQSITDMELATRLLQRLVNQIRTLSSDLETFIQQESERAEKIRQRKERRRQRELDKDKGPGARRRARILRQEAKRNAR